MSEQQARPKPPERTGRCRKFPFCADECKRVEIDRARRGEWPYCVCGHTVQVHEIETETPK